MVSPIEVAFITACTALVSSFVAPFITFRMGRAQIRASVVSNNRQRWIEALRDHIAAFCAQVQAATPIRRTVLDEMGTFVSTDHELVGKLEAVMRTLTTIRLMINPHEADHRALVDTLMRTLTALRTAPLQVDLGPTIDGHVEEIVAASQAILKREWRRVKAGD